MKRHHRAERREMRAISSSCTPARAAAAAGAGLVFLVAGLLFDGLAQPAVAWGRMAHRASARFVESRLTPQARTIIRDLLEPGESLADAATWADEKQP